MQNELLLRSELRGHEGDVRDDLSAIIPSAEYFADLLAAVADRSEV